MAVFQFSALSDGQSLAFNPNADVLNFDQTTIAAADLRVTTVGSNIRIDVVGGPQTGKDVTLQNVSQLQLATTNVTFADGSKLLFGDNSTAQNDNLANSLTGTAGRDLLQGFGSTDTMNGGAGDDTYIVGTGDVLSDSSGVDTVVTDVNWTLGAGFENIQLIGSGKISATGNNDRNLAIGNSGDNYFNMRAGDDTIQAGAGNDWIDMSSFGTESYGFDQIDGGAGADTVNFAISAGQQSAVNVDLTSGLFNGGGQAGAGGGLVQNVEHVIGAGFNDSIKGAAAAETLEGREGNDTLSGMGGNDTLIGGTGQDTFLFAVAPGSTNADLVSDFVSGTDKLAFDNSVFTALGTAGGFAAGDGRFAAGAGFTSGRDASDRLVYNTTTGQLFYDADGNGAGASQLVATLQGAPALTATDIAVTGQANTITGTAGNDSLTGTQGDDSIFGGGGNDTINALGGNDTVFGGDGDDSVDGGTGNDSLEGNDGSDLLVGGDGNDTLSGDVRDFRPPSAPSVDTLNGGLGDDTYSITHLNDVLIDAGGIDTVVALDMDWTLAPGFENLTINNAFTESSFTGIGNDLDNVMINGSRLEGRGGNDTLLGSAAPDRLIGGDGNDFLDGGGAASGGIETLDGGAGNDTLAGGFGAVFVFAVAPGAANADLITNFGSGRDAVQLDGSVYANAGVSGRFAAGDARFFAAAGATGGHDADDRVIYNTTTGQLFYDADGNGAGASQLVAMLQGAPALTATDILVADQGTTTIVGTAGDDSLVGTEGNDSISGLGGNDTLDGNAGADVLRGGDGNDTLVHNLGSSQDGPDTLDGGLGNDTYDVRTGVGVEGDVFPLHPFVVEDAGGVDTLLTNHNLILPDGVDNAIVDARAEGVTGNALDNVITTDSSTSFGGFVIDGGDGNDTVLGGGGFDTVFFRAGSGNYGNDSVDGGDGFDLLSFEGTRSAVVVDMRAGTAAGGGTNGSGSVRFTGIERVFGTDFDDRITGHDGAEILHLGQLIFVGTELQGGRGNDTLIGGTANDSLFGGGGGAGAGEDDGDDSLSGGGGDDLMNGGTGDDTLEGGAGNDNLSGDTGSNILDGGDGDDIFFAIGGSNIVRGGAGNDTIQAAGDVNLTTGTVQSANGSVDTTFTGIENVESSLDTSDHVTGDDFANRLRSFGGNDTIRGGGGNDTIESFDGNAELHGEAGNDLIDAGGGEGAVFSGGTGNDTLLSSAGIDTFVFAEAPGSANADIIRRFGGDDIQLDGRFFTEIGPSGRFAFDDSRFFVESDVVPFPPAEAPRPGPEDRVIYNSSTGQLFYDPDGTGAQARQLIATLQSPASQLQATQITVVNGSAPTGGQRITGTAGNDSLTGTNGDDTLDGLGGADTMNGLLGNDTYVVTAGDVLQDSGGVDTVVSDVNWTLGADFENLTMTGTGNISVTGHNGANFAIGNSGNNYFNLRAGNDTIQAGAGNDWIDMSNFGTSSYGDDVIDGGAGTDTVNFAISAGQLSGITVDLGAGKINGGGIGGQGSATVTSIERVIGAGFADSMKGSAGSETLEGREGNDTLAGMGGNDTLVGGTGQDTYLFASAPGAANADLVSDFVSGSDKLTFDNSVFTALGGSGNFAAGDGRFAAGAGFTSGRDASDRLIYNTTTGQLFYDADGNGAGASQLVATMQGAPALTATDIAVAGAGGGNTITGTPGNDSLTGTEGNDSIVGLAGNDTINGLGGQDTLDGGDGDDSLNGGVGADLVRGGNGNDTLASLVDPFNDPTTDTLDGGLGNDTYDLRVPAFVGTPNVLIVDAGGVDTVLAQNSFTLPDGIENLTLGQGNFGTGNALDNVIIAFGNEDAFHVLDGREGNDTIMGFSARDEMTGGAGNDVFVFSLVPQSPDVHSDEIEDFASGADRLRFDAAQFSQLGATGNFTAGDARFASGAGLTSGQDASDRLIYDTTNGDLYYDSDGSGAAQSVLVVHLTGAPTLVSTDITVFNTVSTVQGTAGNDSLTGTEGNDSISGLAGNDTINALGGNDTLDGGAGVDSLNGGLGQDTYIVTAGDILVDAGGLDTVVTGVDWTLGADFENLTMTGTGNISATGNNGSNFVIGNSGNNYFNLRAGNDYIEGGGGNDWIDMSAFGTASYGNDTVTGGNGFDTVNFAISAGQQSAITVDMNADVAQISGGGLNGAGSVRLAGVERVIGTGFNDRFSGDGFAQAFEGREGNDTLSGLGGNDTLTGGAGADSFVFATAPAAGNDDLVTDFVSGTDKIVLDNSVMVVGPEGNFAAGDARFAAGAGFTSGQDTSDRIIYNTTTGQLFYDPDGNGVTDARLIATFQGHPAIAATDITVI